MTSKYPDQFDDDSNLYLVHDFLRVKLADDYTPGDTSITVDGDINGFPGSGILTLTEQCSDIDERAISVSYTSKTDTTFDGIVLLDGFPEVSKSKRITDVTMNVFADHHNQIKDAIIAIENFVGVKGVVASNPLEGTMEARINFLRRLVLQPRAWFTASKNLGIRPLCIDFKDFSSREPYLWVWDFGDGTISTISRTNLISTGDISKCYLQSGIYDVTLTVTNDFGTNSVTIPDYVVVRIEAPDLATIDFVPDTSQILSGGVLRTRVNKDIRVDVLSRGEQSGDRITSYLWEFTDDLTHDSTDFAIASYSIGGIYDIKLTTGTSLGAYRSTFFNDVIDVVERLNLWHMIFSTDNSDTSVTKTAYVYEFGLISETYKAAPTSTSINVTRDHGFLTGKSEYSRQFTEFRKNNGSNIRSTTTSGDAGSLMVYWAEGAASDSSSQLIRFRQFNGFNSIWSTPTIGGVDDTLTRYWNWVALNSDTDVHFILGLDGPYPIAAGSPTNQDFQSVAMSNLSVTNTTFTSSDYANGADELMDNVGAGSDGDFSVYRAGWRGSNGYVLRNDGVGEFFRLNSFYRTENTVDNPLYMIRKLADIGGATKFEGEFVNLANGLYFFNNTGEFCIYNDTDNTWSVGGPGVNSTDFSSLQDNTVSDFDSNTNTLFAASDGDRKAYLFFDYSTRAQVKFNEVDFTFTTLPVRPTGEQFLVSIY